MWCGLPGTFRLLTIKLALPRISTLDVPITVVPSLKTTVPPCTEPPLVLVMVSRKVAAEPKGELLVGLAVRVPVVVSCVTFKPYWLETLVPHSARKGKLVGSGNG